MSLLKTSDKGKTIIKTSESCALQAYRCPAGIWTIGWGHIKNVKAGDKITYETAVKLLDYDLAWAEEVINGLGVTLNQNQFDALVSFVFNLGGPRFFASTACKLVKANPDDPKIATSISAWIFGGDGSHNGVDDDGDGIIDEPGERQKLPGLVTRRGKEVQLYFTPTTTA